MGMSSEKRRMGGCQRWCAETRSFWKGVCAILAMGHDSELKINPPIVDRAPFLPYSGRHVFTKMPVVDTKLIKAVRAAHKCTFNDAIMAALGGAIRRYCIEEMDEPLFKLPVNAPTPTGRLQ